MAQSELCLFPAQVAPSPHGLLQPSLASVSRGTRMWICPQTALWMLPSQIPGNSVPKGACMVCIQPFLEELCALCRIKDSHPCEGMACFPLLHEHLRHIEVRLCRTVNHAHWFFYTKYEVRANCFSKIPQRCLDLSSWALVVGFDMLADTGLLFLSSFFSVS